MNVVSYIPMNKFTCSHDLQSSPACSQELYTKHTSKATITNKTVTKTVTDAQQLIYKGKTARVYNAIIKMQD
jgi:hypothetical protein